MNWEFFIKPSHSGVHLSYHSALPESVKRSVAVEQFRRADRNASTAEGRCRGAQKIETLLYENGYPDDVICSAKQQAQRRGAEKRPDRSVKRTETVLKLPFVDDQLSKKLRQTVRAYSKEVRLVFTSGKSIKDMLVSSSFGTRDCSKTIYKRNETRGKGRSPECRACEWALHGQACGVFYVLFSVQSRVCW